MVAFYHALHIKNAEAEQLATEVAALTGESKTRAITVALRERQERSSRARDETRDERRARLQRALREEIWPLIPPHLLDRPPLTKAEREEILGYGPEGV